MSRRDVPMGDLEGCGCGPGSNEVEGLSGTRELPRAGDYKPLRLVREERGAAAPPPPRRKPKVKKPRSKGKGPYCVLSHKGNTVHCYVDRDVAERVARRFGERSGTKFTVKKRGTVRGDD